MGKKKERNVERGGRGEGKGEVEVEVEVEEVEMEMEMERGKEEDENEGMVRRRGKRRGGKKGRGEREKDLFVKEDGGDGNAGKQDLAMDALRRSLNAIRVEADKHGQKNPNIIDQSDAGINKKSKNAKQDQRSKRTTPKHSKFAAQCVAIPPPPCLIHDTSVEDNLSSKEVRRKKRNTNNSKMTPNKAVIDTVDDNSTTIASAKLSRRARKLKKLEALVGKDAELKDGHRGDKEDKYEEVQKPQKTRGRRIFPDHLCAEICGKIRHDTLCGSEDGIYCSQNGEPIGGVDAERKCWHLFEGDYFVEGKLQIKSQNCSIGFVYLNGLVADVLLDGFRSLNRGFDGDIVLVKVRPETEWVKVNDSTIIRTTHENEEDHEDISDSCDFILRCRKLFPLRPTADVVAIITKSPKRSRMVVQYHEMGSKSRTGETTNDQDEQKLKSKTKGSSSKKNNVHIFRPTDGALPLLLINDYDIRSSKLRNIISATIASRNTLDGSDSAKTIDQNSCRYLFSACISSWGSESRFPRAKLISVLGERDTVEAETRAILFSVGIDHDDHDTDDDCDNCYCNWQIPSTEIASRLDLRKDRIFTVDPPTARDLDDAISIEKVPGDSKSLDTIGQRMGIRFKPVNGGCFDKKLRGNYSDELFKIAVHIADASFFVKPNTKTDDEAKFRCTSVYLVQRCIPMLPRVLCERLCSLVSGEDKLAMSFIWIVRLSSNQNNAHENSDIEIVGEWFGRTIIRCCATLAYADAQAVIDMTSSKVYHYSNTKNIINSGVQTEGKRVLPPVVVHDGHQWSDIESDIQLLHSFASVLRKRRFDRGAVSMDNANIHFIFDKGGFGDDRMPIDLTSELRSDANFMIEELMLLANVRAATVLAKSVPSHAILRRHASPDSKKCEELVLRQLQFAQIESQDIVVDFESSKAMHDSLEEIKAHVTTDQFETIKFMCTKPMRLAQYFCAGEFQSTIQDDDSIHQSSVIDTFDDAINPLWSHFALAFDVYTHFTSPIRRYADICVHRLLCTVIEMENHNFKKIIPGSLPSQDSLSLQAKLCNERKVAARQAQDASKRLYMCMYIRTRLEGENENGYRTKGLICMLGRRSFDVFLPKFGFDRKVLYSDPVILEVCNAQGDMTRKSLSVDFDEERMEVKFMEALDSTSGKDVRQHVGNDEDTLEFNGTNRIRQRLGILQEVDVLLIVKKYSHLPMDIKAELILE